MRQTVTDKSAYTPWGQFVICSKHFRVSTPGEISAVLMLSFVACISASQLPGEIACGQMRLFCRMFISVCLSDSVYILLHPATPHGDDQAVMPTPRGRRLPV